ncbi:MFS transporter [Altererythrobacter sp.]|uniref:MFS transporter n=1 Tax=Altererythrobacter sp. TaxID=1872480 RepID=UPI003D02022A
MRRILVSLGPLLISVGILLAGGGLQNTLVSVRANLEGFALGAIGVVMAGYYAGFVVGCLLAANMVRRVGHIRVFAALAALAAAASLIYAIQPGTVLWFALRFVIGFCFAGLYTIIESWINERSTNANRGQVLSIYRMVDFGSVTIGQYLLLLADPGGYMLFSLVAILIALSIVPVALTPIEHPSPPQKAELDLRTLWTVSPLAVAASLSVGLTNAAFWSIGPVFVQGMGYGAPMVASFMSAAIIAGALTQWPIGYLSDLIDRRKVLVFASAGAAMAGAFLTLVGDYSLLMLLAGAAGYGVFGMAIFGLSAAHAADHADPEDFVMVSGGLLLIYGIGSVVGPLVAPVAMGAFGPLALFGYTAAIHTLLFAFGLARMAASKPVPTEQQEDFVPIPASTPAVFEIDERAYEED